MPNLVGMTPNQAEAALNELGLVMTVSANTEPVADPSQDGIIQSQVPSVGATLFPGDIVRVTLGEYTPPPTTTTEPGTDSTPP